MLSLACSAEGPASDGVRAMEGGGEEDDDGTAAAAAVVVVVVAEEEEEEEGATGGGKAEGAEWSRQISRMVLSPCRSTDAKRFRRTFSSSFVPLIQITDQVRVRYGMVMVAVVTGERVVQWGWGKASHVG